MRLNKIHLLIISFIGWLLSPLTWWNDPFINLPLSYLAAGFFNKLIPGIFLPVFLAAYWLTNILGIVLMYIGAGAFSIKGLIKNRLWLMLLAAVIYSVIAIFIIRLNIIRPF
ncbi:MAG: hypothetical protein PHO42_02585 [Candidatus Omnitrophica bacterium]|nr:hypothetical protein [Candidatus Omnitrophota bacterium]